MLYGREKERTALAALLQRARDGRGATAVLYGEPGIGKTALLDDIAAEAADTRVLRATSVEPESDFGYATLHQLLLPVLDRVDRLPAAQAAALGAVFGLTAAPIPDRFLVGLATLSLLSELAGDQPVLCTVDDVHWSDRPSMNVLEFVARRLNSEPIVLVLTSNGDECRPIALCDVLDLPLAALDREAARRLLIERTDRRLSPARQDAILDATGGNPLALIEIPAEVVRDGIASSTPLLLTDKLRAAFHARVQRHPRSLQRLLLLVATAGQLRREILAGAAVEFDSASVCELDALNELVQTESATIMFRHPLMRSAVYHGAALSDRRGAHRALAAAMSVAGIEAERRAWHLGQAVDGPDDAVAAQLDQATRRAAHLSAATSAALFARAGELSTIGPLRSRRYFESAAAWWNSGDVDQGKQMLELIDREDRLDEALRRDVVWLRASMELHTGMLADAVAMLRPLLPAVLDAGPRQAIPLLMVLGEASFHADSITAWSELAEIAEQLPLAGTGVDDALLRLFRGACRVRAGRPDGVSPDDKDAVQALTDPAALCWAGGMLFDLGDRERGRRLNSLAVQSARRIGAVAILVWALERAVSDDIASGRFRAAQAAAEEGRRLAEEIGQANASCWHRAALALLAALTGKEQQARNLAYEVLAEAVPRRLAEVIVTARRALGLVDLAAGRTDSALTNLQPVGEFTHPGLMLAATPDLVEAAVQARRPDLATTSLEPLIRRAPAANSAELDALTARCQALLAAPDIAENEFRRALALHERGDQPMEYARTQLLFGEYLRRRRRRAEARLPLRAALDIFESLGTVMWAERARAELRAAGETAGIAAKSVRSDSLTPQEVRIAQAVAGGCTNREVAAQMFLSARTVDYHLRKIFDKLGVRSRAELIRRTLTAPGFAGGR